jgi:uncharacterized protein (TIGR03032 family)
MGRALESLWDHHHGLFTDPRQIVSQWEDAARVSPGLLRYRTRGRWWETLADTGATLLVTREYEHLVMGLSLDRGRPLVSYMRLPHPSGIAVDRRRAVVHVASTRNPNQVYDLMPVTGTLRRLDRGVAAPPHRPLVPVRSHFYPGSLYLHDLAMIRGRLHASAVGENAVVRLSAGGRAQRVWWPRCIERRSTPSFGQNHLQLNSIAAGGDLRGSYFTASTSRIGTPRPGHPAFAVDGRGVIFSGATREPVVRGLTRPHSARLHRGRIWLNNSGYGELCVAEGHGYEVVARLHGWTRGLSIHGRVAFVGTSRVIPRFRAYAPGLEVDGCECAVHAVDLRGGRVLGSLVFPLGNQIFGVEWIDRRATSGFPFLADRRSEPESLRRLFYAFTTDGRR